MDKHDFIFNKTKTIKRTRRLAVHKCNLYAKFNGRTLKPYLASYEETKRPKLCPIDYQLKRMVTDILRQQERERQQELYMRDGAIAN